MAEEGKNNRRKREKSVEKKVISRNEGSRGWPCSLVYTSKAPRSWLRARLATSAEILINPESLLV